MPTYIEGPDGKVRVPDHLEEASFATIFSAIPRGDEVEIMFIRKESDPNLAEEDGAVAEVVARVFMPRENFENLAEWIPLGIDKWRSEGR